MREELTAYLLGQLRLSKREALELRLRRDSSLREELRRLRHSLKLDSANPEGGDQVESQGPAAADAQPTEPAPPQLGLAERTLRGIRLSSIDSLNNAEGAAGIYSDSYSDGVDDEEAFADGDSSSPRRSDFSLVDTLVSVGVVSAVAMMLLPAMLESREASRRTACQDNQRQLGIALVEYADRHAGYYPHIRPDENAGMFAVRLAQGGGIDLAELQRMLVCASSPLAHEIAARSVDFEVPTPTELVTANDQTREMLLGLMGGSYAYRLGYWNDGRYQMLRRGRLADRPGFGRSAPLLADAPVADNGFRSVNHGGCGQNVLFEDCSVRYLNDCWAPGRDDHLFLNQANLPAAGFGWSDIVLGGSAVTPGLPPTLIQAR